ncbi:hypothetical protein Rin_00003120 [Candidatus Regiella insecticola 5.15]|uniref:Uncharacterized protein n=1 Tax=Candidatus Regiella insecticola 5.15 TaxID=1005043 RepID=G2GX27_9ENTR|nr:hypothetical protein [Candidatus Regiella insecticola]EGY29702.1 hypothetical protein Rin_00003120 [Candidatus Regiella insecticola 5.15]
MESIQEKSTAKKCQIVVTGTAEESKAGAAQQVDLLTKFISSLSTPKEKAEMADVARSPFHTKTSRPPTKPPSVALDKCYDFTHYGTDSRRNRRAIRFC